MKFRAITLAVSVMALAACSAAESGEAVEEAETAEATEKATNDAGDEVSFTPSADAPAPIARSAEDEEFLAVYRPNFMNSCVSTAVNTGAPEAPARELCACALDVFERDMTIAELSNPSDAQSQAAIAECTQ